MDVNLLMADPEELEKVGYKKLSEGKIKEAVKLLLRAAKGYEDRGYVIKAATIYKDLGLILKERLGLEERARPLMLKAAYLYLRLIEEEIDRPEVNLERLGDFCLNVIEAFTFLKEEESLKKYTFEFAQMYEDLGASYVEAGDFDSAIAAYESAYRYYELINDQDHMKEVASKLVDIYGRIAEDALSEGNHEAAAEAFQKVANYIKSIFGYDERFRELVETAGQHYEKASKLAYAEGDLDGMTTLLLKAQYAYLLAGNLNRANLIGINLIKMLNQIIGDYRSQGKFELVGEKLMQLAEALVALGKLEDGLRIYRQALEESGGRVDFRARIRMSIIRYFAAKNYDLRLLKALDAIDFLVRHAKFIEAIETAEKVIKSKEEGDKILQAIYEAEGISAE
ncbi:hypothetical protein PYCH_08280 [Pyrococcus yayanosii CH1]|uniref:Uncharacterized protein n=1 Tax=Pyrococcus yayanosii (strain CH1 / JCM 16557) TaxID=529709 RepID=F8AJ72_PYRYC|nr:hypothetical protein PYCH_08280 [Pyrococcus yayanosii CH1]